jgi:hypothetical protein
MTDTETLQERIRQLVLDYGGELTGLTSDDIADEIMRLVEAHTRLAVEKALAEQREAILWAVANAYTYDPDDLLTPEDAASEAYDACAAAVRDFGKEASDVVHG